MKKVMQTRFGNMRGNCMQACLASILEDKIDSFPVTYMGQEKEWHMVMNDHLLLEFGCKILSFVYDSDFERDLVNIYHIRVGKSPRGYFNHAVVYYGDKMVHDPHPDNTGIEIIKELDFLIYSSPYLKNIVSMRGEE
jgi:hypothetical protein